MPRFVSFVLILGAFVGFAEPAAADDRSTCFDANSAPDARIKACDRLIANRRTAASDRTLAHHIRGAIYFNTGDYDRAIRDYDETIRLEPSAARYTLRGDAHFAKRDYDRAIRDFSEAIKLDPKDVTAYSGRGAAYAFKGDYDRAIPDYDETIRLNPTSAEHNNRGFAFAQKGDYDRAITDLNEAIRLDPKSFFPYSNRGEVRLKKNDLDGAMVDLDESIRLAPDEPEPYAHRGAVWEAKGAIDRARADYKASVARTAKDPDALKVQQRARERLAVLAAPPASVAPPPAPVATVPSSPSERRVALVIGNSAYRNTTLLPNPRNDATDVAAALKALGFEVILETDLDKRGMDRAFGRFARLAREADAALFFYAGHGMQYAGSNFLMPVDAKLQDEAELPYEMAKVDDVIADLARAKNIRIVVLDACRDNPLAERLRARLPADRSASLARGLMRIERTHGLITAFATQPGQVAKDGTASERNSPFTSALLKHLATPGIEAVTVFRRVAQEVSKATGGKQLPELSISLLGDFYFAAPGKEK